MLQGTSVRDRSCAGDPDRGGDLKPERPVQRTKGFPTSLLLRLLRRRLHHRSSLVYKSAFWLLTYAYRKLMGTGGGGDNVVGGALSNACRKDAEIKTYSEFPVLFRHTFRRV